MSTAGKIDVTDIPIDKLVRAAYALSRPQGLGFIHARDDGLDDETLRSILKSGEGDGWCAASTDYVHGRAVKFNVRRIDGRLYIDNQWFDHTTGQLKRLLEEVGLSPDLVDKARIEEAAYRERVKSAAVAYIRGHGGSIRQNRGLQHPVKPGEELPPEVADGLCPALVDKLVTAQYGDDGYTTWKLV